MSLIMKRNSVREFLDKPIPSDLVTKLLTSGMQAPSANNQQPWEFIVAALILITITIVTISYQSIKAAIANPIKSLRHE